MSVSDRDALVRTFRRTRAATLALTDPLEIEDDLHQAGPEVQCPKCLYAFKPIAKMRVLVPEALASTVVGGVGFYTWSSEAMVADVQRWISGGAV